MRVVIDTNSLLVSIGRKSKYRPIFDALIKGKLKLLVSNDVMHEYEEILGLKTNSQVASGIIQFLLKSPDVTKVDIHFKWSLMDKDADDNKFVDCSLNGQADFLVTDDKHFNVLSETEFPFIRIIRTQDFLELIQEMDNQGPGPY